MTMAADKQDKVLNVPPLRFPEFTGEWKVCKVADYGKVITGNTPSTAELDNYINGQFLWVSPADLGRAKYITDTQTKLSSKGFDKTRKLPIGSILVTCIGSTIGKMGMASIEMSTNQQINSVVVNSQHDKHFVYYALQSRFPKYLTSVAVQAVPILSKSSFENLKSYRTTLEEQRKIGTLLNLIDERIATQIRAIEKLQSLMSGICESLLYSDTGENVKLGDILSERIEKTIANNQYEILSSTVKGIFLQREYFSKDIASENNVGYKIVRLNDIVLSPQNLWMGNINFNDKFQIGSVSPSYKIFTIAERFYKPYIAAMLKTHRALYSYELVSEQGASIVRRNLNIEAFEQLAFKIPSYDKQVKIGRTISMLQQQIDLTKKQCLVMTRQKQWLLKQMFI